MEGGQWPLSNPRGVIRLIERAAQIALLPQPMRDSLASNAKRSNRDQFLHLDVILEVTGLAKRDGWLLESEIPTANPRLPDLRLTRNGLAVTVEVTRLGTARAFRSRTDWWDEVRSLLVLRAVRGDVSVSGEVRFVLDQVTTDELLRRYDDAVLVARQSGRAAVAFSGVRLEFEPSESGSQTALTGPRLESEGLERLEKRIQNKGKQTAGAGPTWLRIDDQSGLFQITPWATLAPADQVELLATAVEPMVHPFPHVRGVIVSNGSCPDMSPGAPGRDVGAPGRPRGVREPALVERPLPGGRRRRTLILPVRGSGIVLPAHLEPEPDTWYASEPSWLDWALYQLDFAPLTRLLRHPEPADHL
jgi:hypothetical protein